MHYYHKFAIIGFLIGLFILTFGTIALTTSTWISIDSHSSNESIVYGLFSLCPSSETTGCEHFHSFQMPQYIELIGYIILVIGFFIGVLCTACIDRRSIHFIPPIILIIGTVTIFLGMIFYVGYIVEIHHPSTIQKFHLGYSMILMISTCFIGCLLTAYFSFTAGYIHRHILASVNVY